MALEKVFECPRTLRKFRSGPLGKFLDGFCQWLLDRRFSRGCVRTHLGYVSHLNEYLSGIDAIPRPKVTAIDIAGFLKVYPTHCRHRSSAEEHVHRLQFSMHRFIAYLREENRYDACVSPPIYQPLAMDRHSQPFTIDLTITRELQQESPIMTPVRQVKGIPSPKISRSPGHSTQDSATHYTFIKAIF